MDGHVKVCVRQFGNYKGGTPPTPREILSVQNNLEESTIIYPLANTCVHKKFDGYIQLTFWGKWPPK